MALLARFLLFALLNWSGGLVSLNSVLLGSTESDTEMLVGDRFLCNYLNDF